MFEEEVDALMAIYYVPGECSVVDKEITLKLSTCIAAQSHPEPKSDVKIIISVGEDYPNKLPEFSVMSDDLKRERIANLKNVVNVSCKDLIGQPMLLTMVSTIQEELERSTAANSPLMPSDSDAEDIIKSNSCCSADDKWTTLLHIDHMRSKAKYCKTLEKWTKDLGLCGRLLFYRRFILLVLQGSLHNIKEFIVRLKTVSVDVDSRGHSCKEKMMSVLSEEPSHSSDQRSFDYRVLELSEASDLEKVFTESGLQGMYKKHISNIKGYL